MDQYNQSFPDYGTQAGSSFDQPPQRNTNRTIMIVVGVLLVLCCVCVACALLFYFVLGDALTDALDITRLVAPFLPFV